MHALHKILLLAKELDDNELISEAGYIVEDYPDTHDYYSTLEESWHFDNKEFPKGVIRDSETILKLLDGVKEEQQENIKYNMSILNRLYGKDFTVKYMLNNENDDTLHCMPWYYLRCICERQEGKYTWDSLFLDSTWPTSLVRDELIDDIKLNPNKYAIVLLDLHI